MLGSAERTANFHLGNAIQKWAVTDNKRSAVINAMRMGLIR